jgi:leucyl aminopeptidase
MKTKDQVALEIAARSAACDLLIVGRPASGPASRATTPGWELPAAIQRLLESAESPRVGERRPLMLAGRGVRAVALWALPENLDEPGGGAWFNWLAAVWKEARHVGAQRVGLALPEESVADPAARARVLTAIGQAAYRFDGYRAKERSGPATVLLFPHRGGRKAWQRSVEQVLPVVRGAWAMRDLANTPPNVADPAWMATRARALAAQWRMKAAVLGPTELKRRGMNGVLAVGAGSTSPPRLVRLEWGSRGPVVALVGKGVTFDTGGISIKPAAGMEDMVYDKSGACLVLGVLRAVAELDLPIRLRAYLPFAENMPDGSAYRPGDIVTLSNGKRVEINNTDAEGRMILADALTWAAAEKPRHLVEFSTLTGACVVALGHRLAGLFTPDERLAASLLAAAERSGEGLWRLPLGSGFLAEMKGTHADLKNSGGRWGGASTAAAFLSQFVGTQSSWAHVDIAGPASGGHDAPGPKGSTGYGVAWVVEWLREVAAQG